MMSKPITTIAGLVLALISVHGSALDLGTIGPTYPIQERDLIEVMQGKLRHMETTGELAAINEKWKAYVTNGAERPKPVRGLRSTETARTFYIDPTYTLDRNVVDEKGRMLYPAGTKVNPFDYAPMSQYLLFFDASDKAQVAFAKRFISESGIRVKPILVAGEPMKLMREWKQQVYFDQGGALTRRFMFRQTPAIVSQEDKRLRVDEVHP